MKRLLLFIIGITCIACPPQGRSETAEEMLSACRPVVAAKVLDGEIQFPSDPESHVCWGAFAVLGPLLRTVNSETRKPLLGACLPETDTRTQLIAIFVHYAENHPERYTENFVWVALSAMHEAFPCKT